MESSVYQHSVSVEPEDLDRLGHVNNLVYLRWCIDAAVAHATYVGWPTERFLELRQAFVVREHRIRFHRPAQLDHQLTVLTWVATMQRSTSLRRYEIIESGSQTILARARTLWAFVDLDSAELRRIPEEIRAAFEQT